MVRAIVTNGYVALIHPEDDGGRELQTVGKIESRLNDVSMNVPQASKWQ